MNTARRSFPGSTSVSRLEAYADAAPDGLAGGTPHLHTVSSEAYLVVAGAGLLQTVDASGFAQHPLEPGALVWFEPGVIHRAVNGGGLDVRVIMSNAGLPEAGDAVMTFPDDVLASSDAYAAAAALPGPDVPAAERLAAAMARRDLAVRGFLDLFDGGVPSPDRLDHDRLERLYARAVALVAPRADDWRARWRRGALADAAATGARLDALLAGRDPGLAAARVSSARPEPSSLGMCGVLGRYDLESRPAEGTR
ncbi:cupin domain-containing protein [Agromyces salentinus]|uniref:Cupin domain-containing protein n=1 Tax=Agromyces salentinus TaxID=269421 RepID=A0ABN2MEA1_9MICO|nr:cupin domain-containing protein [Agromyces salentinus]